MSSRSPIVQITILMIIGTVFVSSCEHRWQGVIAEMQGQGKYVDVHGIKVFYREEGSGPDMVLIHGFGSSSVSWGKVMPQLAERFHTYAIDVIGFGLTDKPDDPRYYCYDSFREQVMGFLDVKGIGHPVLVGNSMGGAISLHCALEYPERVDGLILIDSGGYPMKPTITIRILKMPIIGDIGKLVQGRWLYKLNLKAAYYDENKLTDRWVDYYYAPFTMKNSLYGPQQFLRSFKDQDTVRFSEEIKEISQPTLIIWGKNDSWVPLEHGYRFNKDIEGSRLVIIPECGHVPQEEKPDEVVKAILDFL